MGKVVSPKLALPAKAENAFLSAQRRCPFNVFGYPQLFPTATGVVVDDDVSAITMKYGFEGAGQSAGFGERHDAGSARAEDATATNAATIARRRVAIDRSFLVITGLTASGPR
jgi:hypothetical protein